LCEMIKSAQVGRRLPLKLCAFLDFAAPRKRNCGALGAVRR